MPISEWLDRFETIATSNNWSPEVRVSKFIAHTSLRAYNVVRKLITKGMSPGNKIMLYKETLLKAFRATHILLRVAVFLDMLND